MNTKSVLIYIIAGIIVIAILALVYATLLNASPAVVVTGDTVEVNYTGSFTNGTVFGSSAGGQSLTFVVGSDQMIQGFDMAVIGMKLNQTKTVTIPANQAYGPENPTLIISVPRAEFGNQSVQVGESVSSTSGGNAISGTVEAVNATNVTINFNPLLAGKTLVFKITVIGIQKANQS